MHVRLSGLPRACAYSDLRPYGVSFAEEAGGLGRSGRSYPRYPYPCYGSVDSNREGWGMPTPHPDSLPAEGQHPAPPDHLMQTQENRD